MTTVTLDAIKAAHATVTDMIAMFERQQVLLTLTIREAKIALRVGERYAGLVLNDNGLPSHHLILLPDQPSGRLDWEAAKAWAASVGGELPTRREQSLLFAHQREEFEATYYWSGEQYEGDGAYAWFQGFDDGFQLYDHTSCEARVRAVRRLTA